MPKIRDFIDELEGGIIPVDWEEEIKLFRK